MFFVWLRKLNLLSKTQNTIFIISRDGGNMKCIKRGEEIVNNGFKWVHGKTIFGSIEIGALQPRHTAEPATESVTVLSLKDLK